jgi:hypothetical protein
MTGMPWLECHDWTIMSICILYSQVASLEQPMPGDYNHVMTAMMAKMLKWPKIMKLNGSANVE